MISRFVQGTFISICTTKVPGDIHTSCCFGNCFFLGIMLDLS
uniref:Uncharacterized protein n=1 Tax=Triticum urartu TaxID=4572 RepID=A0A8R7Q2K4_TRIUA